MFNLIFFKGNKYAAKVDIILCRDQLLKALKSVTYDTSFPEELKGEAKELIFITKEIRITTTSKNGSVLIISDLKKPEINVNSQLIKAIARSHNWSNLLISGVAKNNIDIQRMEKLGSKTYIKNVLELRFLAVDIVEKILNGTQPRDLTVEKLFNIRTLDWGEQRRILKFEKSPQKIESENYA